MIPFAMQEMRASDQEEFVEDVANAVWEAVQSLPLETRCETARLLASRVLEFAAYNVAESSEPELAASVLIAVGEMNRRFDRMLERLTIQEIEE